ncbi:hypothetical protein V8C86DRAFT_2478047 [Haematococcus lacustris]
MPSMPHTRSRARGASCWAEGGRRLASSWRNTGGTSCSCMRVRARFIAINSASSLVSTRSHRSDVLCTASLTASSRSGERFINAGFQRGFNPRLKVTSSHLGGSISSDKLLCMCAPAEAVRNAARTISCRRLQSGNSCISCTMVRYRESVMPTTPERLESNKSLKLARSTPTVAASRTTAAAFWYTTRQRGSTPRMPDTSGKGLAVLWAVKAPVLERLDALAALKRLSMYITLENSRCVKGSASSA